MICYHSLCECQSRNSNTKYNGIVFGGNGIYFYTRPNGYTTGLIDISGQNQFPSSPLSPRNVEAWENIIITWDGNNFNTYKNSELFSTATISSKQIGDNKFLIGGYKESDIIDIDIAVDEVRLYDRAISDLEIKEIYKLGVDATPGTTLNYIDLLDENYQDGTIAREPFIKEWVFNEEVIDLNISIVENAYQNTITSNDFIKDGNTLKINLIPDTTKAINKLTLEFKNSNGDTVTVSGSETFWALTKTNHAPRLADGQITQLVSNDGQPALLDIVTYDSDGDNVTLTVEDNAGGTVIISNSQLSASFDDGEAAHTVKIGLSDGKEKVVKEFTVLELNQNSIEEFYSDVDANADYFYAIAFATLKGVVGGQIDSNDGTQRIFRPHDNVSLAEALKMVINAEYKAGLIELETYDSYMKAYPEWAMKYYTFAREKGALDREIFNLAEIHPTREVVAKLIVKTLSYDNRFEYINIDDVNFTDAEAFSDADMKRYGEIAHKAGLFMKGSSAKPQDKVTRAELATVIEKIFMIPYAELSLIPQNVEQGENDINAVLNNIQALAINSNYEIYDNYNNVTMELESNGVSLSNPISTEILNIGTNNIYAIINNQGVKNIASSSVVINYSDDDYDGVQNKNDRWQSDSRYAFDDNSNGIPDILDDFYNLSSYTNNDTIILYGQQKKISDIIKDGGFISDLDNDGIADYDDVDMDGDGVNNNNDDFPEDKTEWIDTDKDGTGNNSDPDDDNDGMSDEWEEINGFDPYDANDAFLDSDGDGFTTKQEYDFGSDPNQFDEDADNNGIPDSVEHGRSIVPILQLLLF
ncbi:MAG: hypothetical protein D3913_02185 [Candidatus Electrothrix sp. LOE1_4_5]|nr:hypothetical protein [Candidatus Electrothrix gigas]